MLSRASVPRSGTRTAVRTGRPPTTKPNPVHRRVVRSRRDGTPACRSAAGSAAVSRPRSTSSATGSLSHDSWPRHHKGGVSAAVSARRCRGRRTSRQHAGAFCGRCPVLLSGLRVRRVVGLAVRAVVIAVIWWSQRGFGTARLELLSRAQLPRHVGDHHTGYGTAAGPSAAARSGCAAAVSHQSPDDVLGDEHATRSRGLVTA